MKNSVEITDRDILVFKLLNKFRVLDAELVFKLANFEDFKYVQKRLMMLYESNYIGRERDGNTTPYVYFLRNKGMTVLNGDSEQKERPYVIREFSQSSVNHELLVAEIAHRILLANPSLIIDEIQTDRELRKLGYRSDRVGDLRIEKFKINIEVENTQKTFKRYPRKFAFNEDGFGQLWILNGFKTLKRKLNEHIRLYITDRFVEAILLEDIESYQFDLSDKAEMYRKQQQLQFDAYYQERENSIREAEEHEQERRAMIEREQALIDSSSKKKGFWNR
ncbi:replication-relaxation family protein [Erysipelothrix anatis]|uniref:replication-relaxation family protein n=1 Tax=Erysipelothrix anatis TaxID=2683713 RepID=UPI00140C6508|nr:replication-relaxation family protein [Erysipelothrix anatis]